MNLADALQKTLVDLLTELRTPETIPAEVGIHRQRDTTVITRPALVVLCEGLTNRHRRIGTLTCILQARVRPQQNEGTAGTQADAFAAWHGAAISLIMNHLDTVDSRMQALGYQLTTFFPAGQPDGIEGRDGWHFDQRWTVEAIFLQ
jgi:hypothetical protein